jgi:hypothetical protein
MSYEIIDNFLDYEVFDTIQKSLVFSDSFPWYLMREVSGNSSDDGYYLVHVLYKNYSPNSEYLNLLTPLIEKINPFSIIRIKANFYPTTNQIKHHGSHVDSDISHKGLIFYLNTNNGKTILNDTIEIDSIANRALFFDPSIPHRSTTCTDDPVGRFNINFNFM